MTALFSDLIEKTMDIFMDDFSVFGETFQICLGNLEQVLNRCKETNWYLTGKSATLWSKKALC